MSSQISIHALLAESDCCAACRPRQCCRDFYPRSPCGERRAEPQAPALVHDISIHALLAESDTNLAGQRQTEQFLSTLSLRRATMALQKQDLANGISIHALLAESDTVAGSCRNGVIGFLSTLSLRRATHDIMAKLDEINNFYPRSPCGERPNSTASCAAAKDFYPRSPCGERLPEFWSLLSSAGISIHALLAESDSVVSSAGTTGKSFLSTLSLRRATHILEDTSGATKHFYPRSPCGERRSQQPDGTTSTTYFYPRSPCGERPPRS